MNRFVDRFRKEQGLTLLELIVALTLFAMIIGIISGLTMFGVRSYHKIKIENSLRDEADIIMSSIISELYTFAPDTVGNIPDGNGILLTGSENGAAVIHKIAVMSGQLVIGGENAVPVSNDTRTTVDSDLSRSKISFTSSAEQCSRSVACDTGLIDINLVLVQGYGGREYTMELQSKFGF
jgi:prepilin-type N-terminal cleavage/methylation domain-containing protein